MHSLNSVDFCLDLGVHFTPEEENSPKRIIGFFDMQKNTKQFNIEMNTVRGSAILLVIIGHSIFIDTGQANEFFNFIFKFIYSFHMPLFFAISGYFSTKIYEIKNLKDYFNYILKKFQRLMYPYFILSFFAVPLKILFSSFAFRQVEIGGLFWDILVLPWNNPMMHLWFLYTLFLIFSIAPLLNTFNVKLVIIILTIIFILPMHYGEYFNFDQAIRYLLFFYIGLYFNTFYAKYKDYGNKNFIWIASFLMLLLISIIGSNYGVFSHLILLITSILGISFVVNLCHSISYESINRVLNYFGNYSYELYLLTWFPQISVRIFGYQLLGLNYNIVILAAFISAFSILPISKYFIRNNRILSRYILGTPQ